MILSDKRLLEKISTAQRDIRNKEKILKQFKEEAGYIGGAQKSIIDNIYQNYSFANLSNEKMFRNLEENFEAIKGDYQLFKEKEFTVDG